MLIVGEGIIVTHTTMRIKDEIILPESLEVAKLFEKEIKEYLKALVETEKVRQENYRKNE